jgi:hypothetical protein
MSTTLRLRPGTTRCTHHPGMWKIGQGEHIAGLHRRPTTPLSPGPAQATAWCRPRP